MTQVLLIMGAAIAIVLILLIWFGLHALRVSAGMMRARHDQLFEEHGNAIADHLKDADHFRV